MFSFGFVRLPPPGISETGRTYTTLWEACSVRSYLAGPTLAGPRASLALAKSKKPCVAYPSPWVSPRGRSGRGGGPDLRT
jgi:hypothetical protein